VKIRHGTYIPGTLVGAYTGHVNTISISGLARPPDIKGHQAGPVWYFGGTGNWTHAYPHAGLLLNKGADKESVEYTSWTYDVGTDTYTFAVNHDLHFSYVGGESAGPVNTSCLANVNGDKLYEIHRRQSGLLDIGLCIHLNLCFKNYVDGDINMGACSLPASGLPVWPNVFNFSNAGTDHAYWVVGSGYSMSGKPLKNMTIRKINSYWPAGSPGGYYYDLTRFFLEIYGGTGFFGPTIWRGYKECGSSSPAGIYTKYDGCGTTLSGTLEVGVLPP
jgi:hypothetical protein